MFYEGWIECGARVYVLHLYWGGIGILVKFGAFGDLHMEANSEEFFCSYED